MPGVPIGTVNGERERESNPSSSIAHERYIRFYDIISTPCRNEKDCRSWRVEDTHKDGGQLHKLDTILSIKGDRSDGAQLVLGVQRMSRIRREREKSSERVRKMPRADVDLWVCPLHRNPRRWEGKGAPERTGIGKGTMDGNASAQI